MKRTRRETNQKGVAFGERNLIQKLGLQTVNVFGLRGRDEFEAVGAGFDAAKIGRWFPAVDDGAAPIGGNGRSALSNHCAGRRRGGQKWAWRKSERQRQRSRYKGDKEELFHGKLRKERPCGVGRTAFLLSQLLKLLRDKGFSRLLGSSTRRKDELKWLHSSNRWRHQKPSAR